MKRSSFAISLLLCATLAATGAQAAGKFEGVSIIGTSKNNPSFFQINVATGKTMSVWSNAATVQIPVEDAAPPPAGDYHLFLSANAAPDASYVWMLTRMESNSGRIWSLTGGGAAPLTWTEVLPPK